MIIATEKLWQYFERSQSIILTHFPTAHKIKKKCKKNPNSEGLDDETSGNTLG